MLFELIASDASSPLSVSERDVAALAACERGTILLDVSVRADVTLMELTGSNGRITAAQLAKIGDDVVVVPNEAGMTGGARCWDMARP